MSRLELPVSLLDRVLGHRGARRWDQTTADSVERGLHDIEPDPLFARRLRGAVVNYYVAAREGHVRRPRGRRQMGALGRGVLYTSLALALSVTAAGAAAQESLPGDPLYGVKLRLEEVRIHVAPPSLRDDLVALALEERIEELEELAAAGRWSLVPAAARRVAGTEQQLVVSPGSERDAGASAAHAVEVLRAVLADAPAAAQPGLEAALHAANDGSGGSAGSHGAGGPSPAASPPDHPSPRPRPTPAATGRPVDPSAASRPPAATRPARPSQAAAPS